MEHHQSNNKKTKRKQKGKQKHSDETVSESLEPVVEERVSCTVDSSSDDEDEYLVVVRHDNAGATVPTPPVEQLAAADRNAVVQDQFDPLDDVVPQDD